MGSAQPPAVAGPAPVAGGYRPWLDGVRAVAVLLVVTQHTMGATRLDLGYVGVGLFFGLSGYLITSLLLDERDGRGRVSLSGFYLRRAARLVPALLLVVAVCDTVLLVQGDHASLRGTLPALTYTANYVQVLDPDAVPVYGPTWSLAVEEHFYLVWPLVLLVLVRRWGLRAALRTTLAVCVASLAWRVVLASAGAPVSLLGMGSLERADALLYGCAVAIAVRIGWRPRAWVFWLGVAGIGAAPLLFRSETYAVLVPGSAVVGLASAAAVVGMDHAAPSWVRSVLSLRPVVVIGVLSYGLYLWHGPLMGFVQDATDTGRGWRAGAALVAVPVAWLSHRFVEVPVRSWARRRAGRVSTPPPDHGTVAARGDHRVRQADT
ncbi:acyltransferase family protein [Geodermatophilus sp. SYSU D00684]